jgi:NitT/TauT family transport system permease protein
MRLILLPSATPLIFASLRVSMARSVKGMINGELLIAVVGLGAVSQNFARAFDAEGVFAVASLVVGVALLMGAVLGFVDGRVNSWVPDVRRKK